MNLKVKIGPLVMKNPVMTASGTFGYGAEMAEFVDLSSLGAIVVKGISLMPRQGNPSPRIWETPCGMLNSIGLQNVGLKRFLTEKLPYLRKHNVPVIVNILGDSVDEYVTLAQALDGQVQGIEMNLSCPNVKKGGILFSSDREIFTDAVRAVRRKVHRSALIVKLSPQSPVAEFAKLAEAEGADAISLINTIPAMAIDVETRRPRLAKGIGGLSGPAIRPVAIRMVWEAYRAVKVPIIGMGGIMTGTDAIEFILAGATAVAVGTANFIWPDATMRVLQGIKDYMQRHKVNDINNLIGGLIWEQ